MTEGITVSKELLQSLLSEVDRLKVAAGERTEPTQPPAAPVGDAPAWHYKEGMFNGMSPDEARKTMDALWAKYGNAPSPSVTAQRGGA